MRIRIGINFFNISLSIISFTFLFILEAVAAPSITSTSGTITNGKSVTISGSSFGTHGDFHTHSNSGLAFAWENFESISGFTNGSETTGGFVPDCSSSNCSSDWLIGTTGNRNNSSKWARRIDLHDSFACNVHGLKKPHGSAAPYSNVAFISFWFKVPHTASSGKFYRQWSGSAATSDMGYSSTGGSSGFTIRTWDYNSNGTVLDNAGWQRIDYIQTSSTHMDIFIVGKNNNSPEDSGAIPFEGGAGTNGYFQAVFGSGKDYGSNFSSDYYGYDDLYISFTKARVEVCDSSSWSSRSHCEIQIPTSWATSEVGIKVNAGSFASGEKAYLYVVDSSGTANSNGFPVTIDGSVGTPSSPQNLRTNSQ